MSHFFNLIISQPFYNGFIGLMSLLPFFDAGVIVIIFTVIVKLILLPLSIKASHSQLHMKSIEKDLNAIKEKYKDNKEEQGRKTIEFYKERGINPFAGFFILIIQLPIIIGLYRVFLKSGLPAINTTLLYSFVSAPPSVNMMFLGLTDIGHKSLLLAIVAGITTYFQASLASGPKQEKTAGKNMQAEFANAMATQMKYVFPIIVVFICYSISGALALYWITSNIFAIVQEYYIRKKYHTSVAVIN